MRPTNTSKITLEDLPIDVFSIISTLLNFHEKFNLFKLSKKIKTLSTSFFTREEKDALDYLEKQASKLRFIIGESEYVNFLKRADDVIISTLLEMKNKTESEKIPKHLKLLSLYLSLSSFTGVTGKDLSTFFSRKFILFYFSNPKKLFIRKSFEFSLLFLKSIWAEYQRRHSFIIEIESNKNQRRIIEYDKNFSLNDENIDPEYKELATFSRNFTRLLEHQAFNQEISKKFSEENLISEEQFLNLTLLSILPISEKSSHLYDSLIKKLSQINETFSFEKFNELLKLPKSSSDYHDIVRNVYGNVFNIFTTKVIHLLKNTIISVKDIIDMIDAPLLIPSLLEIMITSELKNEIEIQKIKSRLNRENIGGHLSSYINKRNIFFYKRFFQTNKNQFILLSQNQDFNLLRFLVIHSFPETPFLKNSSSSADDLRKLTQTTSTKNKAFSEKSLFQFFLLTELLILFEDAEQYLDEEKTGLSNKVKTFIYYIEELNPPGEENKVTSLDEMRHFMLKHITNFLISAPYFPSSHQNCFSLKMARLTSEARKNIQALINLPDQKTIQTLLINNSISLKDMLIPGMRYLFSEFGLWTLKNKLIKIEGIKSRYFKALEYNNGESISLIESLDILFNFTTIFLLSEEQKKSFLSLMESEKNHRDLFSSTPLTEAIQLSVFINSIHPCLLSSFQDSLARKNLDPSAIEHLKKITSLINRINTALGEKKPLINFEKLLTIMEIYSIQEFHLLKRKEECAVFSLPSKTLGSLKEIIDLTLSKNTPPKILNLFFDIPGATKLINYVKKNPGGRKNYEDQINEIRKIKKYYAKNIFGNQDSKLSMSFYIFFDFFNCFNFFKSHNYLKLNTSLLDCSEVIFFNALASDIGLAGRRAKVLEKEKNEWVKTIFEKKLISKKQFLELYIKLKIIIFLSETRAMDASFSGPLISLYKNNFETIPKSEFIDFENTIMALIRQTSNLFEQAKNTPQEIRNLLCLQARFLQVERPNIRDNLIENFIFLFSDDGSILLKNKLVSPLDILYIPNLKKILNNLALILKKKTSCSGRKISKTFLDKCRVLINKTKELYSTTFLTGNSYIYPSSSLEKIFSEDILTGKNIDQNILTMVLESAFKYLFADFFIGKNRLLFLKKTGLTLDNFKKIDEYDIKYLKEDGYNTVGFIDSPNKIVSSRFIKNFLEILSKPRTIALFCNGEISVDDIYRKFSYILLNFHQGVAALSEECITIEDFRKLSDSPLEDSILAQQFSLITQKKGRELLKEKIICFDDLFNIPFLDILLKTKSIYLALLNKKIKMEDIRALVKDVSENEILNIRANLKKLGRKNYQNHIGKIEIEKIKLDSDVFQKIISKSTKTKTKRKRKRSDNLSSLSLPPSGKKRQRHNNSSSTSGLFQERHKRARPVSNDDNNPQALQKRESYKRHKPSSQ